jgi:AAA family ATP:ADP antiporter
MIALNPLFAALVKRLPRARFIALSYRFFSFNLLLFAAGLYLSSDTQDVWLGRAFFIWLSVFNLFVVSVFWALMVDVFDTEQGKRLFGFLAAGATLGAIAGSTITASLVGEVGATTLFFASILFLELALFAVRRLSFKERKEAKEEAPIGGGVLAGIAHTLRSPYLLNICLFLLLFTVTSTFLYFQQATIARDSFTDRASRTAFFAQVDLMVNVLTLTVQLFFTARILRRLGVALTLGILPLFSLLGFSALALSPTIAVIVGFQVLRRAANFSLARPTREILFTVLSREDKYKAKSFIDTVVYRAGDQVGSWSYLLLSSFGLGIAGVALVAVPLSALWLANSIWLGRSAERDRLRGAPASAGP